MSKSVATKLTAEEIAKALIFAQQLLPGAGNIALRYFRKPIEIENKLDEGRFDPVTCADRAVEEYLTLQVPAE